MLLSKSYGCEFEFLTELFWVVDFSSIDQDRLFHGFGEVFWFEFFEFVPLGYNYAAVCVFEALNS